LAYENAVKISSENIVYANKVLTALYGNKNGKPGDATEANLAKFGIAKIGKNGKRIN